VHKNTVVKKNVADTIGKTQVRSRLPNRATEHSGHNDHSSIDDSMLRQFMFVSNSISFPANLRPYKCDRCAKAFDKMYLLFAHIRTHTSYRPHTCSLCAMAFVRAAHLKRHMRTHTDERPYKCDLCMKKFKHNTSLRLHMRWTHTLVVKPESENDDRRNEHVNSMQHGVSLTLDDKGGLSVSIDASAVSVILFLFFFFVSH
jgi:uncharacterized Zn-finger protein